MNLKSLNTEWDVDRTIAIEEKKLIVIRFGTDWDNDCIRMDTILEKVEYDL